MDSVNFRLIVPCVTKNSGEFYQVGGIPKKTAIPIK